MGAVEDQFLRHAKRARKTPQQLMQTLVDRGVTQNALATKLNCTRQAIGRLASKYGVEFPGCSIDIEAVAKHIWGESFEDYIANHPDVRYEDMALELGVSLSTFKRRVKKLGLARRTA